MYIKPVSCLNRQTAKQLLRLVTANPPTPPARQPVRYTQNMYAVLWYVVLRNEPNVSNYRRKTIVTNDNSNRKCCRSTALALIVSSFRNANASCFPHACAESFRLLFLLLFGTHMCTLTRPVRYAKCKRQENKVECGTKPLCLPLEAAHLQPPSPRVLLSALDSCYRAPICISGWVVGAGEQVDMMITPGCSPHHHTVRVERRGRDGRATVLSEEARIRLHTGEFLSLEIERFDDMGRCATAGVMVSQ